MRKYYFLVLVILFTFQAEAQKVYGIITDSKTKEPLLYVNVVGQNRTGTMSLYDGTYALEQTVGELDHLTMEDGGQIVLETQTFTDLSVASEAGEITKINIINRGNGFVKLPLVSDSDTSTGNGASLFAASTITPMVGHVEGISITNFGLDYTTNPSFILNRNITNIHQTISSILNHFKSNFECVE